MNASDGQLLREYATTRSEAAFDQVVQRHFNTVYSTALRIVQGDSHLARDISQAVFVDLARKAASLSGRHSIVGWLYTSTHFSASKTVRSETRRRAREKEAMISGESRGGADPEWDSLWPVVDAAIQELSGIDREAILLRFFEKREFARVGLALGVSEEAARKRVERAVERLRAMLSRRGFSISLPALAALLLGNAVSSAPAGFAAAVGTQAIFKSSGAVGAAWGGSLLLSKAKLALGALATAGLVSTWMQWDRAHRIERERAALVSKVALVDSLRSENEKLKAAIPTDLQNTQMARERAELVRLRGELSRLRAAQSAATPSASEKEEPGSGPEPAKDSDLIDTIVGEHEVSFGFEKSLVMGGTGHDRSKNLLYFIRADTTPASPDVVTLSVRIAELPFETLQRYPDLLHFQGAQNSFSFISNKMADEILAFRDGARGEVISSPRVSTGWGRQAAVSVTEMKPLGPEAKLFEVGETINLLPRLKADASGIDLYVQTVSKHPSAAATKSAVSN